MEFHEYQSSSHILNHIPLPTMGLKVIQKGEFSPSSEVGLRFKAAAEQLKGSSSYTLYTQFHDITAYVKNGDGLVVKSPSLCHIFKSKALIDGLYLSEHYVSIKFGNCVMILWICEKSDLLIPLYVIDCEEEIPQSVIFSLVKPDIFIITFSSYYISVPINQGSAPASFTLSELKRVDKVVVKLIEPSKGSVLSILISPTRSIVVTTKGVYCDDSCIFSSNYSSIIDASFADGNTLFLLMEGARNEQSASYHVLRILLSRSTVSSFLIHANSLLSFHRISPADTQNVFIWYPNQPSLLFLSFKEHLRGILFSADRLFDQLVVSRQDHSFSVHCLKSPQLYECSITPGFIQTIFQDYSPKVIETDPQDISYPRDESLFNDSIVPQVSQFTGYSDIDGYEEFQSESSSMLNRDEDVVSNVSEAAVSLIDLLQVSTDPVAEVISSDTGDMLDGITNEPPFIPAKGKYSIPAVKCLDPSFTSIHREKPKQLLPKQDSVSSELISEERNSMEKSDHGWYESPIDLNDIFHSVSTTPRGEPPTFGTGEVKLSTLFGDTSPDSSVGNRTSLEANIALFEESIATKLSSLTDDWIDESLSDLPKNMYSKVGEVVFNKVIPTIETTFNLLCSLIPQHPITSLIPEIEMLLDDMSTIREKATQISIHLLKEKLSLLIQEKKTKKVLMLMVSLNDDDLTNTIVEMYNPEWLNDSFTDNELLSIADLLSNDLESNREQRVDMILDVLFMYRRSGEEIQAQRKIAKRMLDKLKPYLDSENESNGSVSASIKEICGILSRI